MDNVLSSKAMLSNVKISVWNARKLDVKVTNETARLHNVAANSGRYTKSLIAKEALAKILSLAGEARQTHYSFTLPWMDDGARVLPAQAFFNYSTAVRKLKNDFEEAVKAFVDGYPNYVEEAKQRLNGLFNPADYPDVSEISARFGFKLRVLPMPDSRDFRVDMSDAQSAELRAEVEAAMKEALALAVRDAWERIAETVGAMVERLTAYKPAQGKGEKSEGVFRNSLVDNVRNLVGILPSLNINADARLDALVARMKTELCTWDADELRDNDNARGATAKAAQSILDDVKDFLA